MQKLILNADDYAMDRSVDAAIAALARRGVVTATSVMVLSPRLAEAASELRELPIDKGLHLDFTSTFCPMPEPLGRFIIRTHAGLPGREELRRTIDNQLDLFEEAFHHPPDFVDGHQHVHHLPMVRDALLGALSERYGDGLRRMGLRLCLTRRWRGLKAAIVAATGAAGLERLAKSYGSATNTDFAGVYDFADGAALPLLWRSWLLGLKGDLPLIMCHVAANGTAANADDPIRNARIAEYSWLSSEAFVELCRECSALPVRWPAPVT
jgi:predicted glycoside hydrolase/deacetylase ChbG (UPF0249 family)